MKKLFIVLLICAANYGSSESLKDFEEAIKNGFSELFTKGTINKEFGKSVSKIGLEHFLDEESQDKIRADLICSGCSIAANAIIGARQIGISTEEIAAAATQICITLQIQADHICTALVNFHVDIFMYIIDNKKDISGEDSCSILLQSYDCDLKDPIEWTVPIHEGETLEKPIGNNEAFKILHISDIHYDPTYTPGSLSKCDYPLCCEFDSGIAESEDEAAGYWTDYNCDVPLHFLDDGLKQIAATHKDVDYIYFTGDIIGHRVWDTNRDNNTVDMINVLQTFEKYFGNTPVFPIVGNHEPHPVNVWSPEGVSEGLSTQWVYDVAAKEWGRWLPEDAKESVLKGAYYTVLVKPGFRVVGLNSNIAYTSNWWLLFQDEYPFEQLKWLENILYESEQNNEQVHILSHIPLSDSTLHGPWARTLKKILDRYSNTIAAMFNGHTHSDTFTVYYKSDEPTKAINAAFNGASYTPYSDKNPSYKILSVDSQNFDLLDFEEWIINVTDANLHPEQSPAWFKLYSFKDAYGIDDLNPDTLTELTVRMATESDKTLLKQYIRYKFRDGPKVDEDCNEDCLKTTLCDMVIGVYKENANCDVLMDQWIN